MRRDPRARSRVSERENKRAGAINAARAHTLSVLRKANAPNSMPRPETKTAGGVRAAGRSSRSKTNVDASKASTTTRARIQLAVRKPRLFAVVSSSATRV